MTSREAFIKLRKFLEEKHNEMFLKPVKLETFMGFELDKIEQGLERLEQLEKAIKIMNDALELYVADDEIGVENRSSFIDYEDSELLKEVLNYE